MLYFHTAHEGKELKVLGAYTADERPQDVDRDEFTYRGDLKSFEEAELLAYAATRDTGDTFLPVDQGSGHYPRYDVIRAPKVGSPVSYGFNGDFYPDGYITKVGGTNCSRVYTDTGSVYNRYRKSGAWIKRGGTWSMVQGHRDERNPHF